MDYEQEYFQKFGYLNDNLGILYRHQKLLKRAKKTIICPAEIGQLVNFCHYNFPGYFIGYDASDYIQKIKVTSRVKKASISNLPVKDGEFDLFICCDLLEHIPEEELDDVLEEIDRVTSSNAVLILKVFCEDMIGCGENDSSHITMKSDLWWLDKIFSHTSFLPMQFCSAEAEYAFKKGCYEDIVFKRNDIIKNCDWESEEIFKNGKSRYIKIYKRPDNRMQYELFENNERVFYLISVLPEIGDCFLEYDYDGYVKMTQGKRMLMYNEIT